jgi:type I restriction enzyme S subunit
MTEAGKDASNAKVLPEGTVVVVARGSVGEVIQLGEPMTFNQSCYALDTNDDLLDDYLYYAWQYVFGQVQAVSYGTVFDTITMKSFEDIEIPVPPFHIQEWIAEMLTSFDDKIETNDRICDELQLVAETMYRGLISGATQHSEFKQSELGEIPKTHSIKEVGELLTLEYGKGLPEREREGKKFPVYGSNGVTGRHNESLVKGPGVIVGRKGANFGTIKLEFDDFWPIDTTFYVEPENGESIFYLYHILKDMPFQHLGSDSAVPGLNRNVAHDQKVVVPPEEDRHKFGTKVKKYHKLQKSLNDESRILEDLLETALPHLVSGRVAPT